MQLLPIYKSMRLVCLYAFSDNGILLINTVKRQESHLYIHLDVNMYIYIVVVSITYINPTFLAGTFFLQNRPSGNK